MRINIKLIGKEQFLYKYVAVIGYWQLYNFKEFIYYNNKKDDSLKTMFNRYSQSKIYLICG